MIKIVIEYIFLYQKGRIIAVITTFMLIVIDTHLCYLQGVPKKRVIWKISSVAYITKQISYEFSFF